jgi:hydrogenase maturation protease
MTADLNRGTGWDGLEGRAPRTVEVDGIFVGRGSLVRLRPRTGGDVFDLALGGKMAVVESIQQDMEGNVSLAVVLEADPGRDLGVARQPGHRFFFAAGEVEPLGPSVDPSARTVLVAGIGNVFLADDGFGVEVARRLAQRELPVGVKVGDFGIRGMDLAYELQEDYDAAILIDAVPRGQNPGTLYVIEPDRVNSEPMLDAHSMDPVRVLGLARTLGSLPHRVLVLGCEPGTRMSLEDEELVMGLSPPVASAIEKAVELVESLLEDLVTAGECQPQRRVSTPGSDS